MWIEWTEFRETELFLIRAQKTSSGWEIVERSTWEVRWHPVEGRHLDRSIRHLTESQDAARI